MAKKSSTSTAKSPKPTADDAKRANAKRPAIAKTAPKKSEASTKKASAETKKPAAKVEAPKPAAKVASPAKTIVIPGKKPEPPKPKKKPIPFTIKEPARMKAPPKPEPKPAPKPASSSKQDKSKAPPPGPKQRFQAVFLDSMADSKAAAAKLTAAAGLTGLKRSKGEALVRDESVPALKKSPYSKKQLADFRQMLLDKRNQLVGSVQAMESEALSQGSGSLSNMPQHMADAGTDTFDQSLALDIAATQRGVVKEVDAALQRIEDNTYGICEFLGIPIGLERLQTTPWTRYSIEAARELERTGMSRPPA